MTAAAKGSGPLSFLTPNFITREVAGQSVRFYAVSTGMVFKLRRIGKPLAKGLAALFGTKTDTDTTVRQSVFQDTFDTTTDAISPELAKLRYEQQQQAYEDILEGLLADENRETIGAIILDSIRRDAYPDGDLPNPGEFLDSIPLTSISALVSGVMEANKGVFGPLELTVSSALSKAVEETTRKLVSAQSGKSPASENPPPSLATEPTPG
jgi:hypothetical protein